MARVAIISDTHLLHRKLDMGSGDIVIHCGDMLDLFRTGQEAALAEFDAWLGSLDFVHRLVIGGNHDHALQAARRRAPQPLANALYLEDEEVTLAGLRIYASPWVPDLPSHAFFGPPERLARAWAAIPAGLDILATHTPPAGVLDRSRSGRALGCPLLAVRVREVAPRVHCFGHVHASAGEARIGPTRFVNASSLVSGTGEVRPPVRLTL